jgi:hypothetical protein
MGRTSKFVAVFAQMTLTGSADQSRTVPSRDPREDELRLWPDSDRAQFVSVPCKNGQLSVGGGSPDNRRAIFRPRNEIEIPAKPAWIWCNAGDCLSVPNELPHQRGFAYDIVHGDFAIVTADRQLNIVARKCSERTPPMRCAGITMRSIGGEFGKGPR